MKKLLNKVSVKRVQQFIKKFNPKLFLEIGSNDGIMLQNFVSDKIPCLGIEPSKNVAEVARKKGIEVITEFFDKSLSIIQNVLGMVFH